MKSDSEKVSWGYLGTLVVLMGVFPAVSVVVERASGGGASLWDIAFRWFVCWGVGVRLLLAGMRQVLQPSFTARAIFHLESPDAAVVVRELGLANICIGLTATVAGFAPSWRMAGAFVGGLYLGIAGFMHVIKRPETPNEWVALVSDLYMFVIAGGGFVHALVL